MTDAAWDAARYLAFADERTRPARELAARVRVACVASAVDLGCGPGNSTRVVAERWPEALVTGVDDSGEMIAAAREADPDGEWVLSALQDWEPASPVDVVFSNAALQWLPDHEVVVPRLLELVAPGGALAFQVPSTDYGTIRELMADVSRDPAWTARMGAARGRIHTQAPGAYYDMLAPGAAAVDIWETEYSHVVDSSEAVVEWISSTGLRPYLEPLTPAEARRFTGMLRDRAREAYPSQADGRVLFPFRRLFVIAYR